MELVEFRCCTHTVRDAEMEETFLYAIERVIWYRDDDVGRSVANVEWKVLEATVEGRQMGMGGVAS